MVGTVTLDGISPISLPVVWVFRSQATQSKRREQLLLHNLDYRLCSFQRKQRKRQTDCKNLVGPNFSVFVIAGYAIEKTPVIGIPKRLIEALLNAIGNPPVLFFPLYLLEPSTKLFHHT